MEPLAHSSTDRGRLQSDGEGHVVVTFDRRGRTCLVSGRRALEEALDADESVAATVAWRHTRWARLARQVMGYAQQRGGSAYQPYLHPDLAQIPSDHGHERFDLLLAALPIHSGTLLDLGANSGYFCHRFEAAGFDCTAVERSEKEAYFLTALRDACGQRFTVLKGSLTEVELPTRPDVVLALNIFHHFLKTESAYRDLSTFMKRLHPRFMLFESHLPDEAQMAKAHRNMTPTEFAEWVRRTGGFATARELGRATDGRPVFLLTTEG